MEDNKKENFITHRSKLRNTMMVLGGEIILLVGIAILFFYFVFLIRDIINPIVLVILLMAGLIPLRHFMWAKSGIMVVLFLFILWVVHKSGFLIAPFIIGFLIAYLSDPIIIKLEKKIPRLLAVIAIFIPLLALAFVLVFFVVPSFIEDMTLILEGFSKQANTISASVASLSEHLTFWVNKNIPIASDIDFRLDDKIILNFLFAGGGFLDNIYSYIANIKIDSITKVFSIVFSYFVILPFVAFYFMLDFKNIRENIVRLIPLRWKSDFEYVEESSNSIINNYIGGMSILAIVFFVVTYILLKITNTDYALSLAFMRGIFNFVPFIGPFVAFIIALPVAMFTDDIWWHGFIKMLAVYGLVQIFDSGFLAPKILGKSVKIHATAVMFGTIIGGVLFGFLGVFIAIPVIGILLLLLRKFSVHYFHSKFYQYRGKK